MEKVHHTQIGEIDKSKALNKVRRSLEIHYGYRDWNPLAEIDEKNVRQQVEIMSKGLHTLLVDISYCLNKSSREYEYHLQTHSFLANFTGYLPPQFREKYRDQLLAHGKRSTFQGLMDFVKRAAWATKSMERQNTDQENR